jgi:hypothetical protein
MEWNGYLYVSGIWQTIQATSKPRDIMLLLPLFHYTDSAGKCKELRLLDLGLVIKRSPLLG